MQPIALRSKGARYPYRAIKKFEGAKANFEDDDEDDNHGNAGSIIITEQAQRGPEFTGILTADEMPIFRFYMPKPGIGFLAEGVEEFEPEAFMYGISRDYGIGDDEDDNEEVEE